MLKATISQGLDRPVLTLWADANFSGRSLRFRGNLGVRSLSVFNYNDVLSSFRMTGNSNSTLVLFQDDNYQGTRRVYRGPTSVSFLNDFNDTASSFILSRDRLSNSDINRIQNRGQAPSRFGEVLPNGTVSMGRKLGPKKVVKKAVVRKAVVRRSTGKK